ncbi:MAG: pitrilysin family protein [Planctomycetota bacterium]
MRARMRWIGLWLVGATVGPLAAETPSLIPGHPKELTYSDLKFQLPKPEELRVTLSNGMVVYVAEDRMLPTFDLTVTLRAGSAFDPPGKAGLASLTGEQMRDGGTQDLSPEELDERIEFLAAQLFTSIGGTSGAAGISLLSKDIDAGLELLTGVLRYPRFDETRLRLAKERQLQNMKRRNDSTAAIERSEWDFLMFGEEHFSNQYAAPGTINAITREDLISFHQRYIHPANMMIAVSGDFERAAILEKLERAFSGWPAGEPAPKTFPAPAHQPKPGVYVVHKEEVNQGRVSIGHLGCLRGTPDEFALQVMNGILGASGFQSRLVSRVRSDEGLAYNTGSRFGQGVYYADEFRAWFQSKSNSCAYATKIVVDEMVRLRNETASQADVDNTVKFYVESFPQRFQSKMTVLGTYVNDEYTGRDPKYWQSYVENLKKVTPADVQRVAQKYLHPDHLVILAVGDAETVAKGGYDKAPDVTLEAFGALTRLSLRNPETMKR